MVASTYGMVMVLQSGRRPCLAEEIWSIMGGAPLGPFKLTVTE